MTEAAFKLGQRVQLRTMEVLPTDVSNLRADPPVPGGPTEFWIYAVVKAITDDGKIAVEVNHPANRQHGARVIVDPASGDLRTKADVLALHAALVEPNSIYRARKLAHLKTQAESLD